VNKKYIKKSVLTSNTCTITIKHIPIFGGTECLVTEQVVDIPAKKKQKKHDDATFRKEITKPFTFEKSFRILFQHSVITWYQTTCQSSFLNFKIKIKFLNSEQRLFKSTPWSTSSLFLNVRRELGNKLSCPWVDTNWTFWSTFTH